MRKYYYVSPAKTSWALTHNKKVLFVDTLKIKVVQTGRLTAKQNQPSELVIQKLDGTIENRETYGNDPFPPRG